jgi:hypothetical protein
VLARPDGSQRDSVRVCDGIALRHTSLFFRDDKSAIVVCRDAIVEVDMATMQKKVGVKLPWTSLSDDAESCSHTAGRIAVGNRTGQVVEYDVASYKQLARHDFGADHRVDALAYSPDGQRLAVSLAPHEIRNDGQILILEGSTRRRVPNFTDDSGALAFSPEGRELFARTRSFTAARGALADGTLSGSVKISSWLSAAMYLDDSLIAATGAHGLGLLHPAHTEMIELHGRAGEGLAASADRQLLCAGTRDGTIHCWARGGERATVAAQPTPAKPSAAPTTPTTAAIEGSIVSRAGTTLTLALDGSTLKVGDGLRLDKRVESKLGGMSITAWLTIADVRVQTADAKRVTVAIEAEKSSVTLNGQPLDHFTAGSTVKLMPR